MYRPLKSTAEIGGVATSHLLLQGKFSDQAGKCAGYARILTAGNSR